MTPYDLLKEALDALAAHRLRATLSSIGVVFGVATVVTAFAIGEGARRQAFADIGALGIDNLYIRSLRSAVPAASRRQPPAPTLTLADARTLRDAIPALTAVAGLRTSRTTVLAAGHTADIQIVGVTASWRDVVRLRMLAGRWLNEEDVRNRRRVAVIGAGTAQRLFGSAFGVGARVRAGTDAYQVVGLFADEGEHTTIQRIDPAHALIVPISAMDLSLGEGDAIDCLEEVAVRASGADGVAAAAALAAAVLERRHAADKSYELVIPRELLRTRLRAQRTFNAVLGGIGALSLLISGVGIMNIMLASVTERTQEIGVRRAFGATRRDVIVQFAAEAALLCAAGGGAGLVVGTVLAGLVAWLAGWPVAISPLAVVLALALSTGVGLTFGIYPARVASLVEPVEALRAP
jgi:putative ABC transport system permease protein